MNRVARAAEGWHRHRFDPAFERRAKQTVRMPQLLEADLTHSIIGAFYEVYNILGYGFLETVYVQAMERELRARGHRVGREVGVQISYKGEPLTTQRLDMLVDDRVVVEIKAGSDLSRAAQRQVYSYLRATTLEVGLLLHFGPEARFHRIVKPNRGIVGRAAPPSPVTTNGCPAASPTPRREPVARRP